MPIVYDQNFNKNELFTIIFLIIGIILMWKFPKRFSIKESLVYFMYSVFIGMVCDHTISIKPFDYYDVNDNSTYQFMDFLTYLMYGPYGYLYIYFFDYFKIKPSYQPIYIFLWAIVALVMEYIAQGLGVFHYKNGYQIYYSFPIYLLILIPHLYLFKLLNVNKGQ